MILPFKPTSNTERQRQFRARNPGYYGRLHRKRKAESEAFLPAYLAALGQVTVPRREVLMLPAPVETIEIPTMTTIQESHRSADEAAVTIPAGRTGD